MITRAAGSSSMISLRAAMPSFSGIVMSSVVRSGLSSWKRSIASAPLPASPTTSWPPLVRASRDHLAHERRVVDDEHSGHQVTSFLRVVVVLVKDVLDAHGPVRAVGHHEAAGGEAPAVHVQVDRLVGLTVELHHRAGRQPDDLGGGHLRAAELGPHAHGDAGQRGRAVRGARRAVGARAGGRARRPPSRARRARASCARRRRWARAARAGTARRTPTRRRAWRAACARRRRWPGRRR